MYNFITETKMPKQKREQLKADFKQALTELVETLKDRVSTPDNQRLY